MNNTYHRNPIHQALFTFFIAGLFIVPVSANVFQDLQKDEHQTTYRGQTIYVDDNNTEGPWDGTIDHPYQYIQDGIDHSIDGDTVYVFDGNYEENVVVSKSILLIGEEKLVLLTGHGFGTVVKIIAENVTLTGFVITNCGSNSNNAGVMIHSSNNIITDNVIQYNEYYGIYMTAGNNLIYHNNFIENTYQAYDVVAGNTWDNGYPDGGNYWDDYNGTDVNEDGIGEIPYPSGNGSADYYPLIHPYGSIFNAETDEVFLSIQAAIDDADTQDNQTIYVAEGIYWEHLTIHKSVALKGDMHHTSIIEGRYSGDVVTLCANDVSLEGFRIQHSGTGEQNAGIIVNGMNCAIINNIVYENFQGIIVKQSVENTIVQNNEISDNGWNGITLSPGCKGNHIFGNTLTENFYAGIGISDASYNYLFHNNFKSNRHQAYDDATNIWDDGYPSGGNYWDDYSGFDNHQGINQDEPGSDGIGDTSYAIPPDGINKDLYPLMAPYIGGDTIPPTVKIQKPCNGVYLWGIRLLSGLLKKHTIIYGPIDIVVEATDAQSGIAYVEFYIDESVFPNFNDTQEPYQWEWSTPYLFMRKHTIIVKAYDNAGNSKFDQLNVRKYL